MQKFIYLGRPDGIGNRIEQLINIQICNSKVIFN
jgi:hypothetical protein